MTRTESNRLKSLSDAVVQKRIDLHLAKEMDRIAGERFISYLRELTDRDDPSSVKPADPNPIIFDYLEKIDEYPQPMPDVIVDGKG